MHRHYDTVFSLRLKEFGGEGAGLGVKGLGLSHFFCVWLRFAVFKCQRVFPSPDFFDHSPVHPEVAKPGACNLEAAWLSRFFPCKESL